jgi:ankyrin repeat protein
LNRESWQALGQMDSEVAKKQYIDYVKDLFKGFDPTTAVASNGSSPSSSKSRSKELQDGSLLESMAGAVSTMQIDTSGEEWKIKEDVFHYASTGSLDQIKAALSKGIDVNIQDEEGRTMLHWAVDRSQKELVKFLVHEHGAQLNIQDVDGMTCLHYAVSCEDEELTKLLVDANALVDVPDQDGETPLDLASDTIKQILIRKS